MTLPSDSLQLKVILRSEPNPGKPLLPSLKTMKSGKHPHECPHSCPCRDLAVGSCLSVRVRAIGSRGPSPWTEAVTLRVN